MEKETPKREELIKEIELLTKELKELKVKLYDKEQETKKLKFIIEKQKEYLEKNKN